MTPKEKAIAILNDFAHNLRSKGNYMPTSKQCAIMAVKMVILDYAENDAAWTESCKEWVKVKNELEQL